MTSNSLSQDEPEHFRQQGIEEIQAYPDNPRTQPNPMYEAMKDSFRAGGIESVVLQVTKCPGDSLYTVSNDQRARRIVLEQDLNLA